MKIRRSLVLGFTFVLPLLTTICLAAEPADAESVGAPAYADDGSLLRPTEFRSWIFVGASLGLSYSPNERTYGEQLFHNVYLDRKAYRHYVKTGEFPEESMLAMAVYRQANKDKKIAPLQGSFEGELVSLEVAVKDSERFEDGWAYFDFSGGKSQREKAQPFAREKCYNCHAEHAADDHVFVQYYPVLRHLNQQRPSSHPTVR